MITFELVTTFYCDVCRMSIKKVDNKTGTLFPISLDPPNGWERHRGNLICSHCLSVYLEAQALLGNTPTRR